MLKQFVSSALAVTLLFGSAAVLHEMSVSNDTVIAASAADKAPAKVKGIKASSIAYTTANLGWKKVTGAKGYRIYVYDSSSKKYKKLTTITKNTTSYKLKNLKQGKTYKYKVRAYKKINGKTVWGKCSDAVTVCTKKKVAYKSYPFIYSVSGTDNEEFAGYRKKIPGLTVINNIKERDEYLKLYKKNFPYGCMGCPREDFEFILTYFYDEEFFKEKSLILTVSVVDGTFPEYMHAHVEHFYLQKVNGKVTAFIESIYREQLPENTTTEILPDVHCHFTDVKKSAIKDVEVFKTTNRQGMIDHPYRQ